MHTCHPVTLPCRFKILERSEASQSSVKADYKKYLKEKQAKNSSRKVTVTSDSDDDFESPKLLRTSNVNQPSPPSSSSPVHQSEVEDLSVHITCTTQFSSLEYRLAKVEADLAESEQLNVILKDEEKEIESGQKRPSWRRRLDRLSNVLFVTLLLHFHLPFHHVVN